MKTTVGLPAAVLAASLLAACSNRAAPADPAGKTGRAAGDANVTVEHDAEATKEALGRAGEPANAPAATANTMDAAQQMTDIKSALMADKSLDASRINVDTDGATNTVTLTGYVPSAKQKTAAERIAAGKARGYKIVNSLVVG